DAETSSPHVARDAVDAIQAVVDTEVRKQDLEQRDATPVRRVAMADPHPLGRPHALAANRAALGPAARSARRVVLGGVGQDAELLLYVHSYRIAEIFGSKLREKRSEQML